MAYRLQCRWERYVCPVAEGGQYSCWVAVVLDSGSAKRLRLYYHDGLSRTHDSGSHGSRTARQRKPGIAESWPCGPGGDSGYYAGTSEYRLSLLDESGSMERRVLCAPRTLVTHATC